MAQVVKVPLVIAKDENDKDVYLYEGSPLPENLKDGEAKRLAEFLEDSDAKKDEASAKSASRKTSK